AAEQPAVLLQHREHMAVANLCTPKLDTELAERKLEAEIAHHGADDRPAQRTGFVPVSREDVDQLIAIDQMPPLVDHHDPVAVAVEREPDVSANAAHGELQQVGARRAAALVDIASIRGAADR